LTWSKPETWTLDRARFKNIPFSTKNTGALLTKKKEEEEFEFIVCKKLKDQN